VEVTINQLAFAYGCLLVAKAKKVEVTYLSEVVMRYCTVSEQAVTVNKSFIIFRNDVGGTHMKHIQEILRINESKDPVKYFVGVNILQKDPY